MKVIRVLEVNYHLLETDAEVEYVLDGKTFDHIACHRSVHPETYQPMITFEKDRYRYACVLEFIGR